MKALRVFSTFVALGALFIAGAQAQSANGGRGGTVSFGSGATITGDVSGAGSFILAGSGGAGGNALALSDSMNNCGSGAQLGAFGSLLGLAGLKARRG